MPTPSRLSAICASPLNIHTRCDADCLREANTPVEKGKPLLLVYDPVRGGAALETIKQDECPAELLGIFNNRNVIEWHRIKVPDPQGSSCVC